MNKAPQEWSAPYLSTIKIVASLTATKLQGVGINMMKMSFDEVFSST